MRYLIIGILFLLTIKASSQSCCSGGTPLTGNLGIQNLDKQQWYLRLSYDYNYLNTLISEDKILPNNTRNRTTQSILFQSSYGITSKLAISTLFSYVQEQQETFIFNGSSNKVSQTGFGDAFILLQYNVLSNLRRELIFTFGPKIPLGKTNARDKQAILLPPDLQPGSGSWDYVAGVSYRQLHILEIPKFNIQFSSGFKYSGKSSRFEGDEGYRFGNEFISSLGLSKGFLIAKISLTPSLQLTYRHTQPDEIDSFKLPSTGGDWFNLNPGLSINPINDLEILMSAEIPIYRNLSGTQLTTSYRLNVGLSYKLSNIIKK